LTAYPIGLHRCPHCGRDTSDELRRCAWCGRDIVSGPVAVTRWAASHVARVLRYDWRFVRGLERPLTAYDWLQIVLGASVVLATILVMLHAWDLI
jgi:hypothetical protein